MNREDIIRKMQEAGLKAPARGDFIFIHWDQIEMLLDHERAAERDEMAKHCAEITRAAVTKAVDGAVALEREACAKLAEETVCDTHLPTGVKIYGSRAAAAIRARGETK